VQVASLARRLGPLVGMTPMDPEATATADGVAATDAAPTATGVPESAGSAGGRPLRVLELFAGMGGMHAAGIESGVPMEVVAAYDVSEICSEAYRHNYGNQRWRLKTIERLSIEELDSLRADVWLMSPPCQPFTRSGKRQDHEDNRTLGLLHLIRVIGEMQHPPLAILLENVIGFERSESRRRLLRALDALGGWEGAEWALDPEDFGLPNRRPRYYALFRVAGNAFVGECAEVWRPVAELYREAEDEVLPTLLGAPVEVGPPLPLGEFLQTRADVEKEEAEIRGSLEVAQEVMQQRADKEGRYDIHLRSDTTSACLTKMNGKLPKGFSPLVVIDEAEAGPLEQRPKVSAQGEGPGRATDHVWRPGVRVRYLSPIEQLRLMGYPETYSFPPRLGFKERAGLIGNSLNVRIVSCLIQVLLPGAVPANMAADIWAVAGSGAGAAGAAALVARGWGPRLRR